MCRLAVYIGASIRLEDLILKPAHNLVEQAVAPREMQEARLNADGYGFGWFDDDGTPAVYTNTTPIWGDHNLETLGHTLQATQWFANVRSATRRMGNFAANTQPFADQEFLFMHNGFIDHFSETLRPRFRQVLHPDIEKSIQGNTDTEYLFALLRQILSEDRDMPVEEGLTQLFATLNDWLGDVKGLFNIVIGDSQRIYAARYAVNGKCPSLYFTVDDDDFPGGMLVASEPLTESNLWQAVPEHHLLILDTEEPAQLTPL